MRRHISLAVALVFAGLLLVLEESSQASLALPDDLHSTTAANMALRRYI